MILFGLIGKTLTHSFSKAYFTEKFTKLGLQDHSYVNFELKSISELQSILFNHPNLKGLNVTVPYKEEIIPFLDSSNELVQQTGACNCIKIEKGKLTGFNTDIIGFSNSLQKHLKPHHQKSIVLGTGGASKAVQYCLKQLQIPYIVISRHKQENHLTYEDLSQEILNEYKIIINTTPLGMYPDITSYPFIPYHDVTPEHLFFDLIYNPAKTIFLEKGEEKGATIINGFEMLIIQAEESWRIWKS